MMQWRGLPQLTAAVLTGYLMTGCGMATERPKLPSIKPDFVSLLDMPGSGVRPVSRGQKPGTPVTASPLELGADAPGSSESRGARIRAVVNGEAILEEEVQAAAMQSMAGVRSETERDEVYKAKLDEIIERELLLQDAIARLGKRGNAKILQEMERVAEREFEKQWFNRLMQANKYTDPEAFRRFLRDHGMPVDMIRRSYVRNFIAMEYVRTRVEPSLTRIGHLQIAE